MITKAEQILACMYASACYHEARRQGAKPEGGELAFVIAGWRQWVLEARTALEEIRKLPGEDGMIAHGATMDVTVNAAGDMRLSDPKSGTD